MLKMEVKNNSAILGVSQNVGRILFYFLGKSHLPSCKRETDKLIKAQLS